METIIAGAHVLDGEGGAPVRVDVAIAGGCIARVGDLSAETAGRRIAADGLTLCPGFIDIHAHDDFNLPLNPKAAGKTAQGVTTLVTGNCGFSPAPVVPERLELLREVCSFIDSGLDYGWRTFAEFLERLPPTGPNVAPLVGHVAVRCGVMGVEERPPTALELEAMEGLVNEAMAAGAFGFSTGLIYPPSCYGETAELTALAAVAARHGGGYFTHMRDEGSGVLDSIREAVAIGRGSGAPVQIAHLKVTNPANWGRAAEVLALVDEARSAGVALHCDQYPYVAASTGLKTMVPQWAHAGGSAALVRRLRDPEQRGRIRAEVLRLFEEGESRVGSWEGAVVAESPSTPDVVGMNLAAIADRQGRAPVDVMLDLLIADGASTLAIYFAMNEADVFAIMRHPAVAIGSDGIFLGAPGRPVTARPHPRHFGTFPRVMGRYAREGVLTLPEAIRKMTSLPADILGLTDRGRLREGCAADLVLFDAATVADTATFEEPLRTPVGIEGVWVNGTAVVQNGAPTGAVPGRVLRRSG